MITTPIKIHILRAMLNPPECGMNPPSQIDVGIAEYKAMIGPFDKATDEQIREYVTAILVAHNSSRN